MNPPRITHKRRRHIQVPGRERVQVVPGQARGQVERVDVHGRHHLQVRGRRGSSQARERKTKIDTDIHRRRRQAYVCCFAKFVDRVCVLQCFSRGAPGLLCREVAYLSVSHANQPNRCVPPLCATGFLPCLCVEARWTSSRSSLCRLFSRRAARAESCSRWTARTARTGPTTAEGCFRWGGGTLVAHVHTAVGAYPMCMSWFSFRLHLVYVMAVHQAWHGVWGLAVGPWAAVLHQECSRNRCP